MCTSNKNNKEIREGVNCWLERLKEWKPKTNDHSLSFSSNVSPDPNFLLRDMCYTKNLCVRNKHVVFQYDDDEDEDQEDLKEDKKDEDDRTREE